MFKKAEKPPESKGKRVFILSENIVKHVSGYDISHQIEHCKAYIIGFSSTKAEGMKDYAQQQQNKNQIMYRFTFVLIHFQPDGNQV